MEDSYGQVHFPDFAHSIDDVLELMFDIMAAAVIGFRMFLLWEVHTSSVDRAPAGSPCPALFCRHHEILEH